VLGGKRLRTGRTFRRVAATVVLAVGCALVGPAGGSAPPAAAFDVPARQDAPAWIWFWFTQDFINTFGWAGLTTVDWAAHTGWTAQQLDAYARVASDAVNGPPTNNFVRIGQLPLGMLAFADSPCPGTNCSVTFDPDAATWNTTLENRAAPWTDMASVAMHEFGHWFGIDHSGVNVSAGCDPGDVPGTDGSNDGLGSRPTMTECVADGDRYQRTVAQDDANALHVARPRYPVMTANDSFEHTTPFWGFHNRRPNGGWDNRQCCDGRFGSYYMSFGGYDSSYLQDHVVRGYHQQDAVRARVWFRRGGISTATVTLALWRHDMGSLLAQRTCSTYDAVWTLCETPTVVPGAAPPGLRVEVYNKTYDAIHIDSLHLT
jgi:hypothetical protein